METIVLGAHRVCVEVGAMIAESDTKFEESLCVLIKNNIWRSKHGQFFKV